jgi:hypothetical protein
MDGLSKTATIASKFQTMGAGPNQHLYLQRNPEKLPYKMILAAIYSPSYFDLSGLNVRSANPDMESYFSAKAA